MARSISSRERNLLVVLLLIGAGWIYVQLRKEDSTAKAAGEPGGKAAHAAKFTAAPVVKMALLERPAEPISEAGRDLFKYAPRPPSPEEVRKMREEAARQAKAAEIARKQEEERQRLLAEQAARENEERAKLPPPPPPPPQPPAIGFKYVGFIGPKDAKIAVFEDGQNTLLASVGDTVQEQFRVVAINYDSVVIGFTRPEFKARTQELPRTGK